MTTDDIEKYFGSAEKVAAFLASQAKRSINGATETVGLSQRVVLPKLLIALVEN